MITNHSLHTAKIKNNCPECFANDGLEFSFTQNENSQKLFTKADKKIVEKLYCSSCNTQIFPVSWDDDIERVYEYNKKQVIPKKTSLRLTSLGYIVVLISIVVVAALVYGVIYLSFFQ
ncbi:MAG: hypothetical protein ACSHW7_04555 [Patiriisocius sp.]|uniref:hypothetical protein n=1 Tax=Patiriisocius sp. TaxID=2822396 RepID=UPI003EF47042